MKSIISSILVLCAVILAVSATPQGRGRGRGRGRNRGNGGDVIAPVSSVVASSVAAAPTSVSGGNTGGNTGGSTGGNTGGNVGGNAGAVTRGPQTQVLFEIGGIPGNECLTFRNNGEIVDAACVNAAADRQLTPSTIGTQSVLLVQRSFSNGFRPDLVNVQACVGFNGTHFKALPCGAAGVTPVSLVNGELQAGTACASGHDARAQMTVDITGQTCVQYTTTDVTATAP